MVCDLETSTIRRPRPGLHYWSTEERILNNINYKPPHYVAVSTLTSIRSPDIPFSTLFSDVLNLVDVHGSVHRNRNRIERTNKMQPCSRIYYSNFLNC